MCKCSTYSWAMGINKVDTNVAWWLRSTSSYNYSPYIAHAVENNGSVVGGEVDIMSIMMQDLEYALHYI